MFRSRKMPPPTAFTIGDKLRLVLSAVMIVLGMLLFLRLLPLGLTIPALLVSVAFIGLGVYRLWLGYTRWKEYAHLQHSKGS